MSEWKAQGPLRKKFARYFEGLVYNLGQWEIWVSSEKTGKMVLDSGKAENENEAIAAAEESIENIAQDIFRSLDIDITESDLWQCPVCDSSCGGGYDDVWEDCPYCDGTGNFDAEKIKEAVRDSQTLDDVMDILCPLVVDDECESDFEIANAIVRKIKDLKSNINEKLTPKEGPPPEDDRTYIVWRERYEYDDDGAPEGAGMQRHMAVYHKHGEYPMMISLYDAEEFPAEDVCWHFEVPSLNE